MSNISLTCMTDALDSLYDKAIGNVPVLGSAIELAESYRHPQKNIHSSVDSLIRWQCAKTAGSGFLMNLPGGFTAIGTIPADITSTIFIQLRMIAAIAHLYTFDVKTDQVRTLAFLCLCGKGANEVLQKTGIKITQHLLTKAIMKIPKEIIININKAVGMRLITKFGTTGVFNLGKLIPLAGGIVGGSYNLFSTRVIGLTAKNIFG